MIVFINLFYISRLAWEANVDIIRKHNIEHDLGSHSYTLGLNKYADLVGYFFSYIVLLETYLYRQTKNSTDK